MPFKVRLRTDYSPPEHFLTITPSWSGTGIAGSYHRGIWEFLIQNGPAQPSEQDSFTVTSSLAGDMPGGNLPILWTPNGKVSFGPGAIHFEGEAPTQLTLTNWFESSQAKSRLYSGIRLLLALILLTILLGPLPLWAAIDGRHLASSKDCPGKLARTVVTPVTTNALFKLSDTSTTNTHLLAFDRSRNSRIIAIRLTPVALDNASKPSGTSPATTPVATTPATTPATTINGFLTRDDGSTLNANLFYTQTVLQSGQVLVTICALRHDENGTLGAPGTYTGIISVAGSDVVRTDIPIVVTLSYPAWQLVLELLALVLVPAAWYLWVLHDSDDPAKSERRFLGWGLVQYALRRIGFLSLAVGALAAFSVYSATYLRSDTWGSNVTQWLSLFGAMFTAFITAAGGVHLGAKAVDSKAKPPAGPS